MKVLIYLALFLPLSLTTQPKPPMNFESSFNNLMVHEGGYSNVKADPGGETMLGITKATAAAHGYTNDMAKLPVEVAKAIYKESYWDKVRADELPEPLKFHVFDAAVNSGVAQAIKWLQRSVGVKEDGVLGPATLGAVKATNPQQLTAKFNGERLEFMTRLKTWQVFGTGWARRIATNMKMTEA